MACEDCPTHNFGAGRLPTGNDDPCNTSGDGIYCTGSYWSYDPAEASGQDLIDGGDCQRLFQRTGDTCTVNEWLEIPIADTQYSADAPTTEDCCPPGTLWVRPDSMSGLGYDELYMSYADFSTDPPTCRWCLICTTEPQGGPVFPDTISVVAHARSGSVTLNDFDGNPATDLPNGPPDETVLNLAPASAMITNPSLTRDMTVQIVWQGYMSSYFFQQSYLGITGIYSVQPYFYIDGVLQNNPFTTDSNYHRVGVNGLSDSTAIPTSSWTQTVTIGPGASVTASMEASITCQISHSSDLAAQITVEEGTISLQGVLV